MTDQLKRVCRAFRIEGQWVSYEEISVGNINHTYKVNFIRPDGQPKSYIVQKVNTYVYKNPIQVMENIDRVTEHIRAKSPARRHCISTTPLTARPILRIRTASGGCSITFRRIPAWIWTWMPSITPARPSANFRCS